MAVIKVKDKNGNYKVLDVLVGPKGDPFTYNDFTEDQLNKLKGPKGDKGDIGLTGPQGEVGPKGDTGAQGNPGPKGDTGSKGETGPQGEVGPKGDTGNAATLTVGTVTTGEPGTNVIIENTGTEHAAVLNFTIPKGEKGDTGSVGPQGAIGPKGDTGLKGDKGETGLTGAQGQIGDTGPKGDEGATFTPSIDDSTGVMTWTNNKGLPNPEPVNVKGGPQGPKGDKGDPGDVNLEQLNAVKDIALTSSNEVIKARIGYTGKEYDDLKDRIDGDVQFLLDKTDTENFEGYSIHAKNTYARNLNENGNDFEVQGKTKQNLFDVNACEDRYLNEQGALVTGGTSLITSDFISVKPSTSYACTPTSSHRCKFYNLNKEPITGVFDVNLSEGLVFKTTSDTAFVRFTLSKEIRNTIDFEEGTVIPQFTPYGLYSDEQTVIKTCGANWFTDKNIIRFSNIKLENGIYKQINADTSKDIILKLLKYKDGKYVGSFENIAMYSLKRYSIQFTKDYTFNRLVLGINGSKEDSIITFDANNLVNGKTYNASLNMLNLTQGSISWNEVMISEGDKPYEPYQGSTTTIPRPLRSAGEAYDKFYLKDGKPMVEENIKNVILNGSEQMAIEQQNNKYRFNIVPSIPFSPKFPSINGICDKLSYASNPVNANDKDETIYLYQNGNFYLRWDKFKTVEELKNYLRKEPLTIQLETNIPTTEQVNCEDLVSFKGETNITTTDIAPKYMKVSLPADTKASYQEIRDEVVKARTGYFGGTYKSLDERLDHDFNKVLGDTQVVNYKGTEINAKNTLARNLNVNGNKFEVQGKTIQNLVNWEKNNDAGLTVEIINGSQIHLKGTPTRASSTITKTGSENAKILEGITGNITMSIDKPLPFKLIMWNEAVGASLRTINVGQTSVTFNNNKSTRYRLVLDAIKVGTPIDITFNICVSQGDYADATIPYGLYSDPKTVVKTWGKNYLNYSKENFEEKGLKFVINSDKSINITGSSNSAGYVYLIPSSNRLRLYKGTYTLIGIPSNTNIRLVLSGRNMPSTIVDTGNGATFTIDEEYDDIWVAFNIQNVNASINLVCKPMIVEGNIVGQTPAYQPYEEHLVTIPRTLRSAGDVHDRFYLENGKGNFTRNVSVLILTDKSNIGVESFGGFNRFFTKDAPMQDTSNILKSNAECNQLTWADNPIGLNDEDMTIANYYGNVYFRWDRFKTVEELNQHLKTNPIIIQYMTNAPEKEILDVEDVVSLNGVTNMATLDKAPKTIDVDMPSDVKAVTQTMMAENRTLKAENQKLSKQVEQTQANTDYVMMMTGVE